MNTEQFDGHSHGPWYWDGNLCNDEYSEKHGMEQWCVFDWEEGLLAKEEDMRLIAAAPELLAALIDARRMVKELHALLERVGHEDDAYEWATRNIGHIEMTWWNPEACVGDEE